MEKLTHKDLLSLEEYSEKRYEFKKKVMEHKKHRCIQIGENASLYFEDGLTMRYQIQEMLRAERIFEVTGIDAELAVYNPLIPDGSNWKATFMLEYPDVDERHAALTKMINIEDKVWIQVRGYNRVWAIANEDLDRSNAEKTSSVHFLRFELNLDMLSGAKSGHSIAIGIDHPEYSYKVDSIPTALREQLLADLI
jgi:hypothetical protein